MDRERNRRGIDEEWTRGINGRRGDRRYENSVLREKYLLACSGALAAAKIEITAKEMLKKC